MTCTRLATHLENLKDTIILASNSLLTSFSIKGNNIGFILLLKGFMIILDGNYMLNYNNILDLQIFITPCKDIRKILHKTDIPLLNFWTEWF
jgi:hypothetical protein